VTRRELAYFSEAVDQIFTEASTPEDALTLAQEQALEESESQYT
jgi:hypothetical protein